MNDIYLDNSATTRPYDEVIEMMAKVDRCHYGNPSALHSRGLEAVRLIKDARRKIAAVLDCREDEIVFTSGGTEANNMAIRGAACRHRRRGNHLITTAIEHPSVLNCYRRLEQEGFTVSYLPVDAGGYICLDELAKLLCKETILVSIIHVNNEIGTVQKLETIGTLIKEHCPEAFFHVDGVQSFGKIAIELRRWRADLFSCSAHKIHGPKGVGALWVKRNTLLQPIFYGGDQEGALRPGTENTAGIAGFGLAAAITEKRRDHDAALMNELKTMLYRGLREEGPAVSLNGPPVAESAPHILNLSFNGIRGEVLLHALEQQGIYTSPGSACHSRRPEPSHVLQAIGLDQSRIAGALRFSFSGFNSKDEIAQVIEQVRGTVREYGARKVQ